MPMPNVDLKRTLFFVRSKKLLVAPGITSSNKKLVVTKGIATTSKKLLNKVKQGKPKEPHTISHDGTTP